MFRVNDYILIHIIDNDDPDTDGIICVDPDDEDTMCAISDICEELNMEMQLLVDFDGFEIDGWEWFEYGIYNFHVNNYYDLDIDWWEYAFNECFECNGDCDNCEYTLNNIYDDDDDDLEYAKEQRIKDAIKLLREYGIGDY